MTKGSKALVFAGLMAGALGSSAIPASAFPTVMPAAKAAPATEPGASVDKVYYRCGYYRCHHRYYSSYYRPYYYGYNYYRPHIGIGLGGLGFGFY